MHTLVCYTWKCKFNFTKCQLEHEDLYLSISNLTVVLIWVSDPPLIQPLQQSQYETLHIERSGTENIEDK